MSEAAAWSTIRQHLIDNGAHVQRLEDKLHAGIPDASVCCGSDFWLEGKFVEKLPKRDSTRIRFGEESRVILQRNWLHAREKAGGKCFVWLRVQDFGWFLFRGPDFGFLVDGIPKAELSKKARSYFGTAKAMVTEMLAWVRA